MDSGNSGSMQSSSCGDEINNNNNNEEYDSRAESNFSSFLNNPLPTQAAYTNPRASSSSSSSIPQHHTQMFDPLSNYYMDSLQKSPPPNQNSFLNLDMVWSKATARSEANNADLISASQQNQAFLLSQLTGQTRIDVAASLPTTHQSLRGGSLTNDQQTLNNNNNNNNNMIRNPKKRSRASRRAPTTVLTTDTTNFRAMVQEFTGIPAPPFSSPFPRTRLDLFGSSRSVSMESHQQQQPPPYILRPFAQKIQPLHHSFSSFQPSSSMVENTTCTNSPSINYHLLQQQQQNPLNMHNQILGFQSNNINSQTHPKYQLGSLSNKPTLEITPNVDSHMKMSVFEELGLTHTHAHVSNNNNIGVVHQQNMIPASSTDGVNNNNMRNIPNSEGINYRNDIEERESNGKGSECVGVATRGEGTVESWINCSSH